MSSAGLRLRANRDLFSCKVDLSTDFGGIPKRPTGADCKSAGLRLRWFESTSLHQFHKLQHGFAEVDENHWFDKFVWNKFEQPEAGPEGASLMDETSNPPPSTSFTNCCTVSRRWMRTTGSTNLSGTNLNSRRLAPKGRVSWTRRVIHLPPPGSNAAER